jgi:ribosomal protein S28E/S33
VPGGYGMLGAAIQVLVAMLRSDLVGRHVTKNALEPFDLRDLLRKRNGRRYTACGFSAIWQRLMDKATAPGRSGSGSFSNPSRRCGVTFCGVRTCNAAVDLLRF